MNLEENSRKRKPSDQGRTEMKTMKPNKRDVNMVMEDPEIWKEVLTHLDKGVHESAFLSLLKRGINAETKAAHVCKLTEELNQRIPFLSDDVTLLRKKRGLTGRQTMMEFRTHLKSHVRKTGSSVFTQGIRELHVYGVICSSIQIWDGVSKVILRPGYSVAVAGLDTMYEYPDMPQEYRVNGSHSVYSFTQGELINDIGNLKRTPPPVDVFPMEFLEALPSLHTIETRCNIVPSIVHNWEDYHYYVAPMLINRAKFIVGPLLKKFELESPDRDVSGMVDGLRSAIASIGVVAFACCLSFALCHSVRILMTYGECIATVTTGTVGEAAYVNTVKTMFEWTGETVVPIGFGIISGFVSGGWIGFGMAAAGGLLMLKPSLGGSFFALMLKPYQLVWKAKDVMVRGGATAMERVANSWPDWAAKIWGATNIASWWFRFVDIVASGLNWMYSWVSSTWSATEVVDGVVTATSGTTKVAVVLALASFALVVWFGGKAVKQLVTGFVNGVGYAIWWVFHKFVSYYNNKFAFRTVCDIPKLKNLTVYGTPSDNKKSSWLVSDRVYNWATTILCGNHDLRTLNLARVSLKEVTSVFFNEKVSKVLSAIESLALMLCVVEDDQYMLFRKVFLLELRKTYIPAEAFETVFKNVKRLTIADFGKTLLKDRNMKEVQWSSVLSRMSPGSLEYLRIGDINLKQTDLIEVFNPGKQIQLDYISTEATSLQFIAEVVRYLTNPGSYTIPKKITMSLSLADEPKRTEIMDAIAFYNIRNDPNFVLVGQ